MPIVYDKRILMRNHALPEILIEDQCFIIKFKLLVDEDGNGFVDLSRFLKKYYEILN